MEIISAWATERTFEVAVKILQELAPECYELKLAKLGQNSFIKGKIYNKVDDLLEALPVNDLSKNDKKEAAIKVPETLAAKQLELTREKAALYKQAIDMRKLLFEQNRAEIEKNLQTRNSISVREMVKLMEEVDRWKEPVKFSITYVTFNRDLKRGGEIRSFKEARLTYVNKTGTKQYNAEAVKQMKRKPAVSHWKNATRDMQVTGEPTPRRFHIFLVFEFNGMRVTLSDNG